MKNYYRMRKKLIFFIIAFTCLILLNSLTLFSQQTGTIAGKIIDAETAEPLRAATVAVIGTQKGTYTDARGEFRIKDIPVGTQRIKVTYIGYVTQDITDVIVKYSETTSLSIVLTPQSIAKDDILVEARRSNDNEAAILAIRKSAMQLSNGISIEEIKRMPDSDAGQSLKRVSGVTLLNDKYVVVRGVSERYSNTTLNGTSLATTEPDKKAFAFDMFPSEFLENANVTKSFTPDLPGNFAGGLVQLNTIDFPQAFSLKFSVSSSITDNISLKDNKFLRYNGGTSDWLGFDDGTRSLPSSVPSTSMEMKSLINSMKSQDESILIPASEQWLKVSKSFNNSVWKKDSVAAPPNGGFNFAYTDIFNVFDNDLGVIASAMYNNSYSQNTLMRGTLQASGDNYIYFGNGLQSTYSTTIGGLLNIAYKIGSNHSISFKNTINNSSDDETSIINGYKEQVELIQYGFQYVQKSLYSGQLSGEHYIPFQNSRLDWTLGYSVSVRDEPDFRRIRYSRNDETEPYRIDIYDLESNGYQAGRFYSNLQENAISGGLNYLLDFDAFKVKLGGFHEEKYREFKVRSFTINKSTQLLKYYYDPDFGYVVYNYGDEDFYDYAFTLSPDELFSSENFSFTRLGMSEETRPIDSYKADENLSAGYIMADFPVYIGDNKLRIIGGVRLEHSSQLLKSYYPITLQNTDSTFVERNILDFLPSLNLVYELNKEMNLRASMSKTLTRPSLREYAPFTFYDFQFQGDVTGNPYLERALIQNYDLRWEMFPNPGEVISVGAFYKIFDNAIEETIIPTSSNFKRTFTNAKGNAYNYGMEFEFRKSLGFISNVLNNITFNANLAIIKSEITVTQVDETETRSMWGQSPYSLNLGLFYSNQYSGTTCNIAYNVCGKRIIQVADIVKYEMKEPHIYELPRNQIDATFTQSITENFDIKVVAKDILNESLVWEQAGKQISTNLRGRNFSLNLSYKIK